MIGKRIGERYEVIKGIGEGGMSKVYLAHDIILGRDVAIKVLNYDFANELDIKKRFQREALSATSLTHPHIVNIYDVDEEGELHYFVMEYIEGQTLKKYIQSKGPLPVAQAVNIMKQLVSAIANAHHNGIIHRDIKPQNILMDADGDVKITDFGIAMALHATAHTKTNSVIGTVHYLSPEQARGGMATKKSDIYSLGIVFYELLTGELPFSAETAVAIALKHLQEETPSVRNMFPDIPQSVENVILKATAKDATYRYQSADEMYDDLLTVLSPTRQNETKFTLPFDDDKTRVIPVITESPKVVNHDTTKIIEPVTPEPQVPVKKKRKKWPIFVSVSIALIVIALLALFLPSLLGPKDALIPEVAGLDEAEARDLINETGFVIEGIVEDFSDEYEAGQVFKTIPEAGKKRELGTSVTLYVSKGKDTMEMTDYTGKDYDEIFNFLQGFHFKSIKADPVYSDEPEGRILEQTPAEGEHVVPGETDIVFKVSQGKKTVKLEDLTNLDKNQVDAYAKSSGFDIRVVKEEYHDTIPEGNVISQDPPAGTDLPVGAKVGVVRSKGQEKKPVRVYVRPVDIPYESTTVDDEDETSEPEPQTVKIYIHDNKHSMTDPVAVFTITEDTRREITIELEEGQRGRYIIYRGDTVIEDVTVDYDDIEE